MWRICCDEKTTPGFWIKLIIDNNFTSLWLIEELGQNGHDCTDTIHSDQIKNASPPHPKAIKKLKRGSYEHLTNVLSGITVVQYNDNSVVTLASNKAGVSPIGTCNCWTSIERKKISVNQPACVIVYNLYMGGVNWLDQNVLAYRPSIRMKK